MNSIKTRSDVMEETYQVLEKANQQGLTLRHFMVLMQLDEVDHALGSLAKKLGLSSAAMTGMGDRMERLGLVVRRHSPSDRRKIMMRITKLGRMVLGLVYG